MDFSEIRRLVVIAMFSDEVLLERFVPKGGNALELVHQVITRGSIDVDLSIAGEFVDLEDTKRRIFQALRRTFMMAGLHVFDETFRPVPLELSEDRKTWWGGYYVEFKLMPRSRAEALRNSLEQMRRQAETVDRKQGRTFRVEISKYEYCTGKFTAEIDGHTIYVYTEEMCVVEKFKCWTVVGIYTYHGRASALSSIIAYFTVHCIPKPPPSDPAPLIVCLVANAVTTDSSRS